MVGGRGVGGLGMGYRGNGGQGVWHVGSRDKWWGVG